MSRANEFRRDIWVRAQPAGLEIKGYRPTERDKQEVAKAVRREPNPTRVREQGSTDRADAETSRVDLAVPFAEGVGEGRWRQEGSRRKVLVRGRHGERRRREMAAEPCPRGC